MTFPLTRLTEANPKAEPMPATTFSEFAGCAAYSLLDALQVDPQAGDCQKR